MNTSSLKLLVLLAVLGLLGMGPGMCKRVEMTEQQNSISTEPGSRPETVVSDSQSGRVEEKTEAGKLAGTPSSEEEVSDSDAHRFVMVYQALMDGETDPCG